MTYLDLSFGGGSLLGRCQESSEAMKKTAYGCGRRLFNLGRLNDRLSGRSGVGLGGLDVLDGGSSGGGSGLRSGHYCKNAKCELLKMVSQRVRLF
jgi:hypothetical protein